MFEAELPDRHCRQQAQERVKGVRDYPQMVTGTWHREVLCRFLEVPVLSVPKTWTWTLASHLICLLSYLGWRVLWSPSTTRCIWATNGQSPVPAALSAGVLGGQAIRGGGREEI